MCCLHILVGVFHCLHKISTLVLLSTGTQVLCSFPVPRMFCLVQYSILVYFFLRLLLLFFPIPLIIFALLCFLISSRNSNPGSHSRLFSPLSSRTVRALHFFSRDFNTWYIITRFLFFSFFLFSIPFIIFALLFSLRPSRNSNPGSHSRLFSPPAHYPLRFVPCIFFREKIPALPSSTRVELCLPMLLKGALSS